MGSLDQDVIRIQDQLGKAHLLAAGHPDFITRLASGGKLSKHSKGYLLFQQEDKAEYFYLILSGWVKLYRETLDGSTAVIDILTTGHIFGESAIFEDHHYAYAAELAENAEIVALKLSTLRAEIESNSEFALSLLRLMTRHRRQQAQEIEHRTIQNTPQRIGCFFLRLVNQRETGPVRFQLPYDKTLVAARLGMKPETFSRALQRLRDETGIEVNGSNVVIHCMDTLVSYSCGSCSADFPCKDI